MEDFPPFMKHPANLISPGSQFTDDIEGYVFDGVEGSQMAFWTCRSARSSLPHAHPFDEYVVCVAGQYRVIMDGRVTALNPGDEFFIPAGTTQAGECEAGTRTIHAFGGTRAMRAK